MPQSTISRIESGTTSGVDFETLDKVAAALEIHPSELIAFNKVTFDVKGKSYVAVDVTQDATEIPPGASTVWQIQGTPSPRRGGPATPITFGTQPGAGPGAVIKAAKKALAG